MIMIRGIFGDAQIERLHFSDREKVFDTNGMQHLSAFSTKNRQSCLLMIEYRESIGVRQFNLIRTF